MYLKENPMWVWRFLSQEERSKANIFLTHLGAFLLCIPPLPPTQILTLQLLGDCFHSGSQLVMVFVSLEVSLLPSFRTNWRMKSIFVGPRNGPKNGNFMGLVSP